ncbi:MAG: putative manganese transporter, partial [Bacteroidales bacterium]|nr:putative manganese transporter [Bacteroidales bacterium]
GIIPESGPHFIFVILYSQGVLPFSILLANSIAQDGHGTLPLLAESRKGFIMVKAVSILFAMAAGVIGLISGW